MLDPMHCDSFMSTLTTKRHSGAYGTSIKLCYDVLRTLLRSEDYS